MIDGVEIKQLKTHPDERGYFREVIRVTDAFFGEGFAQLSHSFMHAGVAKAWHIHKTQVDWWYVPSGALKLALYDARDGSPTNGQRQEIFLGDSYPAQAVKIPPGVAHGCRALAPTHLLYVTSRTYDPAEEGRIPHDDATIGYNWLAGPPIT
jgi:dTDP-4-dehydrorhamnose 3,5-epimerase